MSFTDERNFQLWKSDSSMSRTLLYKHATILYTFQAHTRLNDEKH